jgi:hypothetical protein
MPIAQSVYAAGRGNAWTPPAAQLSAAALAIAAAMGALTVDGGVVDDAPTTYQKYVRQGASGSGSGDDWTNAYTSLPGTLTRDTTYWVADGSYGSYTFTDAASGSLVIRVKKATATLHGTDTGWSSGYGDGQATFGDISFDTAYNVFDGTTGGGVGAWKTGHGFKVSASSGPAFYWHGANCAALHCEVVGNGGDSDGAYPNNDLFSWFANGAGDNARIAYCWAYDAGRCIFFCNQSVSGVVVEHCCTGYHESTAGEHSEIASIWGGAGGWTFRHNLFTHAEGTGGLIFEGDDFKVYGNVFYRVSGDTWEVGNGAVGSWSASTLTNCKVYNNTFLNVEGNGGGPLGALYTSPTTGNAASNNLFVNGQSPNFALFPTHDYNHFINAGGSHSEANGTSAGSGDPFVDYAGLDFRLTANTSAGSNLGAPYGVDMYGNTRTTWTRGAVEYV